MSPLCLKGCVRKYTLSRGAATAVPALLVWTGGSDSGGSAGGGGPPGGGGGGVEYVQMAVVGIVVDVDLLVMEVQVAVMGIVVDVDLLVVEVQVALVEYQC